MSPKLIVFAPFLIIIILLPLSFFRQKFQFFSILVVSMATLAILKIPKVVLNIPVKFH
jgi:hypothetical protein